MVKNGIVIYYSWIGNTKVVAEEIQRLTGFPLLRIEEKRVRQFGNIMGAAMRAFFGLRSNIKTINYSLNNIDNIFIGSPVWAGKTPPAFNKFLSKAKFKGKNVWVFITKSEENIPLKVIDSIKNRIEKKGGKVIDNFSLTTHWDPKTNIPLTEEEVGSRIQDWIKSVALKGEE